MGLFTHSTKPSDDLLEHGIRGTATVDKAEMAGTAVQYDGSMSKKKQEELLTGERSMVSYKLRLTVEIPGSDPYSAKVTVPVPMQKARFMAGGSTIPVLVDPKKKDRIAIDWDGEFQQGTVAEMAASNPMIAAALKGAGIDADAVSAQQRAMIEAGHASGNVIIGGQLSVASQAEPGLAAPPPAFATPQQPAAPDTLAQLKQLGELRDSGVLTDTEFEAQKARILSQ
jgi:hypothetical protein